MPSLSVRRSAGALPALVAIAFSSLVTPAIAQPGEPGQRAQRGPGLPNPDIMEFTNERRWTLRSRVEVRSWFERRPPDDRMPEVDHWRIETAAVIFPAPNTSASHRTDISNIRGEMRFDGHKVADAPDAYLEDVAAGAGYIRFGFVAPDREPITSREMIMQVEIPMRSYRTVYNDQVAERVPWWQEDLPDELKRVMEPQPYIEFDPGVGPNRPYDTAPVDRLIAEWTDGASIDRVKSAMRPAVLAKFLAGRVAENYTPSGNGLLFNHAGQFEAIEVYGPTVAARELRGTPFDMATLLASVYRRVGIPARVVIGYDVHEQRGDRDRGVGGRRGGPAIPLRSWVEFALYDERDGSVTWIPVDPQRMRRVSSRMPRNYWQRPVRYFGSHDELDGVAPIAFHFFPPTTVRSHGQSGMPAFWGWLITPTPPDRAFQALVLSVSTTPITAEDQRREREQRRNRE